MQESCWWRTTRNPEKTRFPVLPAYEQVLKCSHLFNLLDARGAISVTERVGVIKRVRDLAVGTAKIWVDHKQGCMNFFSWRSELKRFRTG